MYTHESERASERASVVVIWIDIVFVVACVDLSFKMILCVHSRYAIMLQ